MKAFGARPLCFVLLIAWLAALPAAAASVGGQVVYEGTFDAGALSWQRDREGAAYPVLGELRGIDDPGRPRLPLRTLLLLVPADAQVLDAWVEPLSTHEVKSDGNLAVAEPLFTDTGEYVHERRLPDGGASFPAAWGRYSGTHTWRGYRLLALEVYPLRQTLGADGATLEFLDSFAVRVRYGTGGLPEDIAVRERFVAGDRAGNEAALTGLVANPAELSGYARQDGLPVSAPAAGFVPDKTPSLSGSAVSYLIVTNEAMRPAFETLASFKTAQGLPTVVATREYIEANFRHGADFQETLRMFIRDAYQKWGLDYVLLGGDSDVLPPRYVINSFYPTNGTTAIPSDLYFACLDGNWNADGDAYYGEPVMATSTGDLADFAEEVYVGRAAVSTPAAATVFVNKVMAYENTAAGAGWTNRVLFAAEVLFPEAFGSPGNNYVTLNGSKFAHAQVNTSIVPCTGMSYLRMYESELDSDPNILYPRDTSLTRAALIDTLNTGHYGIFNQIGHGYYFNMSVGDANFVTTDADNLTNSGRSFVMYALNCASAAFDNSCLLERFVQNPNGGSVCSLGSARAAFPNNANSYQQEFFSKLYCTTENRAGRLMALSRLPFIGLTANNYVDRWTFENYTLLGDPTLPIWTSSPKALTLTVPASLGVGPQNAAVTVMSAGVPVVGATVCLRKTGEVLAYAVTNAAGQVTLPVLPTSAGTMTVTVSGRDLALKTQSVPVVAGGAYLKVESLVIADNGTGGSIGNGDGFADAGETIAVWPVLRETGGVPAAGITATVSCADPGVTVVGGSTSFPGIAAGGSSAALTPMLVAIAGSVADATTITLAFDAVTGGVHSTSNSPVTVRAPQVEVVSLDWEDVTWGDGNGGISNGERLGVTVILKNFGTGATGSLTGRLRSDSPYVTRYDSVATFTSIALLGQSTGSPRFSMAIDPFARQCCADRAHRRLRPHGAPRFHARASGHAVRHPDEHDAGRRRDRLVLDAIDGCRSTRATTSIAARRPAARSSGPTPTSSTARRTSPTPAWRSSPRTTTRSARSTSRACRACCRRRCPGARRRRRQRTSRCGSRPRPAARSRSATSTATASSRWWWPATRCMCGGPTARNCGTATPIRRPSATSRISRPARCCSRLPSPWPISTACRGWRSSFPNGPRD